MADDKGGSGSEWGVLEVVLVCLLVIAILNRLQGNREPLFKIEESPTEQATELCGLTINSPKPLEKVGSSVLVRGQTNGCDWNSLPTVALYAQVIDSKGKPVSDYTAIPPLTVSDAAATFATSVTISGTPAAGTGYLILIPATSSTTPATARIPVQFRR